MRQAGSIFRRNKRRNEEYGDGVKNKRMNVMAGINIDGDVSMKAGRSIGVSREKPDIGRRHRRVSFAACSPRWNNGDKEAY